MIITWKQTGLGIFYPTFDGRDVTRDLFRKHGCTFGDAPVADSQEEAIEWANERGYESKFDFSRSTTVLIKQQQGLSLNDI